MRELALRPAPGRGALAFTRQRIHVPAQMTRSAAIAGNLPVLLALAFASVPVARAETIQLPCVADTTLFESSPNDNMGGWTHVAVGTTGSQGDRTRNRGLYRFNPAAALPAGATVLSAQLKLAVTGQPTTGAVGSTFELHRVLQDWGEGVQLGDRGFPAAAGEATWNWRFAPNDQSAGGQPWNAPGGAAGIDFATDASAAKAVTGLASYTFGPSTALAADVQGWLGHPGQNFGWLLLTQKEDTAKTARRFGSREDADHAPMLIIDYTLPLRLTDPQLAGGGFQFSFAAGAGRSYSVETNGSLNANGWGVLTNLPTPARDTNFVVSDSPGGARQFYRVKVE